MPAEAKIGRRRTIKNVSRNGDIFDLIIKKSEMKPALYNFCQGNGDRTLLSSAIISRTQPTARTAGKSEVILMVVLLIFFSFYFIFNLPATSFFNRFNQIGKFFQSQEVIVNKFFFKSHRIFISYLPNFNILTGIKTILVKSFP